MSGSDEEIVMGMTRGLQGVDVTAHPLKDLLSRPRTVLFFSPHPSLLPSLLLLSAVQCSGSWHETSGSWGLLLHLSLLVFLLSSH